MCIMSSKLSTRYQGGVRDHSFSMYAKFSENQYFSPPDKLYESVSESKK